MPKGVAGLAALYRGDNMRISRLHTERGDLCLSLDILPALALAVMRLGFGYLAPLPWLTFPAIHYLAPRVKGRTVFQYGSGMGDFWLAKRALSLVSVESNPAWAARVHIHAPNVTQRIETDPTAYTTACDDDFDVVIVDGVNRTACLQHALSRARKILVVDNTDKEDGISHWIPMLERHFPARQIKRFPGYAPGLIHATETTIVDLEL